MAIANVGPKPDNTIIMAVASIGGHFVELHRLLNHFTGTKYVVTYESDRVTGAHLELPVFTYSPFRVIRILGAAMNAILKIRPNFLITTGSEIAIPFVMFARLMGIRTFFVESACRRLGLSRSAKLCYLFGATIIFQGDVDYRRKRLRTVPDIL